jgi:hypothetical protein
MCTYRLKSSVFAVERVRAGGMIAARIPTGAILDIEQGLQTDGMIEIVYDGRKVMLVLEDLYERAECLDKADASTSPRHGI